jgi:formylglycine-generating enzyme required for sulfatase activity
VLGSDARALQIPVMVLFLPASSPWVTTTATPVSNDELPVHDVSIDAFYMEVFETTNEAVRRLSE